MTGRLAYPTGISWKDVDSDFADGVEELVKNAAGRDPEVLQDQQLL